MNSQPEDKEDKAEEGHQDHKDSHLNRKIMAEMQKLKEENNKYTRILEGLSLALAVEEDTDFKIVSL